MSLPALTNLPITVDVINYKENVLEILASTKPQWSKQDIVIKEMTEGFVNRLLQCKCAGDEEKLMVRVFGDNQGIDQCFNRASEVDVMRVLAHEKLMPPVYCKFNNGVVYGFAPGNTLNREDLLDKKIREAICQAMHSVHSADYAGYLGEVKRPGLLIFTDRPWEIINENDYSDVEQDPRFLADLPSMSELRKIQQEMHVVYDELSKEFPIVYSHADCHLHNIVYDSNSGKITLIDWEGANWCPEVIDPTILFDRDPRFSSVFSSSSDRRELLEDYLRTHPIHGREPVTAELIDRWYSGSVKASMVTCFNIVSFCLASVKTSPNRGDFLGFSIVFYKRFKANKEEYRKLAAH